MTCKNIVLVITGVFEYDGGTHVLMDSPEGSAEGVKDREGATDGSGLVDGRKEGIEVGLSVGHNPQTAPRSKRN